MGKSEVLGVRLGTPRSQSNNQITIPDVELEVEAMARVREQIHGGAEGKILANSTVLGNLPLLMFLTTKESKSPFRASMPWLRIH
jgi:hypothetical protein